MIKRLRPAADHREALRWLPMLAPVRGYRHLELLSVFFLMLVCLIACQSELPAPALSPSVATTSAVPPRQPASTASVPPATLTALQDRALTIPQLPAGEP